MRGCVCNGSWDKICSLFSSQPGMPLADKANNKGASTQMLLALVQATPIKEQTTIQ